MSLAWSILLIVLGGLGGSAVFCLYSSGTNGPDLTGRSRQLIDDMRYGTEWRDGE